MRNLAWNSARRIAAPDFAIAAARGRRSGAHRHEVFEEVFEVFEVFVVGTFKTCWGFPDLLAPCEEHQARALSGAVLRRYRFVDRIVG